MDQYFYEYRRTPANTWVYHIEASNFDKGTAYAVFDGHTMNDMTPYAYKTTDFRKDLEEYYFL